MTISIVDEKARPTSVTVLVDRELRERLERAAAENERSLGPSCVTCFGDTSVRCPRSDTSAAAAS